MTTQTCNLFENISKDVIAECIKPCLFREESRKEMRARLVREFQNRVCVALTHMIDDWNADVKIEGTSLYIGINTGFGMIDIEISVGVGQRDSAVSCIVPIGKSSLAIHHRSYVSDLSTEEHRIVVANRDLAKFISDFVTEHEATL